MKVTLLCRSSKAWSWLLHPKCPEKPILFNPAQSIQTLYLYYRSSPLQQTGTSLCCCRTCDGREVALKIYTAWRKSKLSANVAFANARWWHQAEYTSTITLNAILQRHNYSCKNRHGTMHPAVQHVHDTHDLITLQLTMWEFCTCSLVLYEQRPTAPRPWSKLFGLFWNGACCSYSLLFYGSCKYPSSRRLRHVTICPERCAFILLHLSVVRIMFVQLIFVARLRIRKYVVHQSWANR